MSEAKIRTRIVKLTNISFLKWFPFATRIMAYTIAVKIAARASMEMNLLIVLTPKGDGYLNFMDGNSDYLVSCTMRKVGTRF